MDITNPKGLRESQKKAQSLPKRGTKLSLFASGTQKWLLKKTSQLDDPVSEPDISAIRPKTNLAPGTGPAKLGEGKEVLQVLEVLSKLEKHEAECNLRYERIEEKLGEQKNSLHKLDYKIWAIALLIVVTPVAHKFLGQ